MTVDPATARHRTEHDGRAYYFCCAGCLTKFVTDPAKYLKPAPAGAPIVAAPAPTDAIYTCPMHPEVRQAGPGACPICGMALEPEVATARPPRPTPSFYRRHDAAVLDRAACSRRRSSRST